MLINDHDPKPLYYQFAAEHAGEFVWEYSEKGPIDWRVRIGKRVAVEPEDRQRLKEVTIHEGTKDTKDTNRQCARQRQESGFEESWAVDLPSFWGRQYYHGGCATECCLGYKSLPF